jgi:RNA-directed DNA polymerase
MQPAATHIETIRRDFTNMRAKEDLLQLLNTAKLHLDGGEHRPIEARSLNYYANPQLCKSRYRSFTVKKKTGGDRVIHAPTRGLKSILRALNHVLQCVCEPHRAAMGFVPNKCIRDNAAQHIGALYVYNLDLKDFFHSFDRKRVKWEFMLEPFGLRDEREPLAFLLASLCTHPFELDGELRTVLPQGSPASPTITNILCRTLDRRLSGMAKRFGVKYTRYADDITFSSMTNVFRTEDFQTELKRIIEEDQLLVINPSKTRLQTEHYRQEVTGLIVNEKVNVPRRYVKQVRMYLHYWEKYGYQKAQSLLARDYPTDRGHDRKKVPALRNVLDGKLLYLKMVKGDVDNTYRGLHARFRKLTEPQQQLEKTGIDSYVQFEFTDMMIPDTVNDKAALLTAELSAAESGKKQDVDLPHNPEKVVALLRGFTRGNSALKYATHVWDNNSYLSIQDFFDALKLSYGLVQEIQGFNSKLWYKIYKFVFQDKLTAIEKSSSDYHWGRHKITIGWQYPSTIKDWAIQNYDGKGVHARLPMAMELPEELRPKEPIGNRSIVTFEDVVKVFKSEIEFRDDDLYLTVKKAVRLADIDSEWQVDKAGLRTLLGKSFYTDTEKVESAVIRALQMFKARPAFTTCLIKCYRDNEAGRYVLELLQHGSYSDRELTSDKLVNLYESGDLQSIVNSCLSVCHLSIESRFTDANNELRSYELELLYAGIKRPFRWKHRPLDKDAEGFKFKFIFPD